MSAVRVLVPLVLLVAVLAAFAPALRNDFVNYDDDLYVTRNPWVQRGLTATSVRWAFTTDAAGNWHPLTWLSHQLDWELFGPAPAGHHATSVVLHGANTVLLWAALQVTTAAPWRAALAAGLFGLHPLHVESVAWVAERKDVLSTCLWLLTTLAWVGWTRRGGRARYGLVVLGLAAALMAKPMAVTLPFTLVLLDYWPLARWDGRPAGLWPRVREKLPLFALAAASAAVTWSLQHAAGVVGALPLGTRVGHAIVTWATYLGQTLWPARLAVIYPHPGAPSVPWLLTCAALLAAITAIAVVERRRRPWLLVGWLWYVGTLVPVIGLVQVGAHAMADRFTYVPLIGIFVAVAWLLPATPAPRAVAAAAAAVLAVLAVRTRAQVGVWRDSVALFSHALAVEERNAVAHVNLGAELAVRGDLDAALRHLERGVALRPDLVPGRVALGNALMRRGRTADAIAQYEAAAAADPVSARALTNLGYAQLRLGRLDDAVASLERALRIDPSFATAHNDLGMARARLGDVEAARRHFQRAVEADPGYADAHSNLAAMLLGESRLPEALAHATQAVRLRPELSEAHANRVVALVRLERLPEAWAAVHEARAAGALLPDWLPRALAARLPEPRR